ncbi:pro-sigmaK processing inhibitor BofA family protein [Flintibacter sp.]|uniref:pro-sigmaK processing inhibitor BofA family protein n=1 Tax=Flintibacter sp. TaxID=1918624 RepID=UPI003D0AD54B|nr:pro-sigmaK processing inhibitor BofA family protein [Flintibacter sp.]
MTAPDVPWLAVALLALSILALLHRPLGRLLRLAARSAVGLAVLALFSQVGQFIGVSLGVNLINALILGVLGVPGFGLLLMLQWVLR